MSTQILASQTPRPRRRIFAGKTIGYVFMTGLFAGLVGLWYALVFTAPISLWGVPLDPPVMSLAQAVNIDFWLREHGPRALSQAQYYQPGVWYQMICYLLYRMTGGYGTPEQIFGNPREERTQAFLMRIGEAGRL